MLVLSRKAGETICIGDEVTITVVRVSGDKVRLGIDAPRALEVHRGEVYAAIQAERKLEADAEGEPHAPLQS